MPAMAAVDMTGTKTNAINRNGRLSVRRS